MMTRKHYDMLVAAKLYTLDVLHRSDLDMPTARATLRVFASELAWALKIDNPAFDADRFRKAFGCCGKDGKFPEEKL